MELIIKSDDKASLDKIISLAKQLHVVVEEKSAEERALLNREAKIQKILNYDPNDESARIKFLICEIEENAEWLLEDEE